MSLQMQVRESVLYAFRYRIQRHYRDVLCTVINHTRSTVIERHVAFPSWKLSLSHTHTHTHIHDVFYSAYWCKVIQNRGVSKSWAVEEDNSVMLICANTFKVWGSTTLKYCYINYSYTSHCAVDFVTVGMPMKTASEWLNYYGCWSERHYWFIGFIAWCLCCKILFSYA
jgi:hypothetical protein